MQGTPSVLLPDTKSNQLQFQVQASQTQFHAQFETAREIREGVLGIERRRIELYEKVLGHLSWRKSRVAINSVTVVLSFRAR